MALPIYGLFMKKIYGDRSLPYTQDAKFDFPTSINLCEKEYYGSYGGSESSESNAEEESIDGIFE